MTFGRTELILARHISGKGNEILVFSSAAEENKFCVVDSTFLLRRNLNSSYFFHKLMGCVRCQHANEGKYEARWK